MNINESPNLINECKTIEENCLYTSIAHYGLEQTHKRWEQVLKYALAALSAASGGLLVMGLPSALGWLAIGSGLVSALVTVFDVDKKAREHGDSAREFTVLRHDARTTYQTFAPELAREDVMRRVERLVDRYNELISRSPSTTERAFQEARRKIQSEVYAPDFMTTGKTSALMQSEPQLVGDSIIPGEVQSDPPK